MDKKIGSTRVMWGLGLIAVAALIILDGLNLIGGFELGGILLTVLWGILLFDGIMKTRVPQILFSLAFLAIVWDRFLGIQNITPWPVLGAALLGSIGYTILFGKNRFIKKHSEFENHNNFNSTVDMEYGEVVNCHSSFGETVKYINSENLKQVNIQNSFSVISVYFDKAIVPDRNVIVNISNSFGGIELFIPSHWMVENKIQCSFAGVDEKGRKSATTADSVTVILQGNTSFGGVTIVYI